MGSSDILFSLIVKSTELVICYLISEKFVTYHLYKKNEMTKASGFDCHYVGIQVLRTGLDFKIIIYILKSSIKLYCVVTDKDTCNLCNTLCTKI